MGLCRRPSASIRHALLALDVRDPLHAKEFDGVWFVKLLKTASNMVTASDGGLVYPRAHPDQTYVARLDEAAKYGGVTVYMNGQDFGGDGSCGGHRMSVCAPISPVRTAMAYFQSVQGYCGCP